MLEYSEKGVFCKTRNWSKGNHYLITMFGQSSVEIFSGFVTLIYCFYWINYSSIF